MKTFGVIELAECGKQWRITKLEPHVSIRLKTIFPRLPKAGGGPLFIPHNPMMDADIEWFMSRYPLAISSEDKKILHRGRVMYQTDRTELERILLPDYEPPEAVGLKPGMNLRPYQWQAVEILKRRRHLLCGDEGGLGKTVIAAGFLATVPDALPAAVVCDSHMQRQWKEMLERFTNLKVYLIKKGSAYSLPKADVYVFRVSQVAGWSEVFCEKMFKAVVYDEPQSLRNGTATNKGIACKDLSRETDYHLGLTATPVYNYGDEMWRIMQFIDDAVLGEWEDFAREWCVSHGQGKYRVKNPKALGSYLREQFVMIRRVKADVGLQLPDVSRIVEYIDYDHKAVEAVEDLARQLAIKASTASFVERGSAVRELDVMMRKVTGVAKAKTVANFVRIIVETGEPVLLLGWHRDVYDIWMDELSDLNPAMYTGSESNSKKEEAKRRFMDGETNVLIMSLRSGVGVDGLQHRCSTVVFGELDWSPAQHQQDIWRIDRDGQKNPVTAFFLVSEDGSDPAIMSVLGIKSCEARSLVDPNEVEVESQPNDGSKIQALVDRYLKRKSS